MNEWTNPDLIEMILNYVPSSPQKAEKKKDQYKKQ